MALINYLRSGLEDTDTESRLVGRAQQEKAGGMEKVTRNTHYHMQNRRQPMGSCCMTRNLNQSSITTTRGGMGKEGGRMCEAAYPTWGHREPDSLCVALKMSFKKHLENPYNALPYP